jgi:hypothetical protein
LILFVLLGGGGLVAVGFADTVEGRIGLTRQDFDAVVA